MNESTLYYAGINEPVLPGDTIQIKRLLRSKAYATVTYILGISKYDSNNGNDQWSYKIDGGDYYVVGYDYLNKHFTNKCISLIARADEKEYKKMKSFVAPPETESDASVGSELLWLFGLAIGLFLIIFVVKVLID